MISLAPLVDADSASNLISLKFLEYSGPLVKGTTQNEQNLSHPSCIVIADETPLDFFSSLI